MKVLDFLSLHGRHFGMPLGRLCVIWGQSGGHFGVALGRLGLRLGDLWALQGPFWDLMVAKYRFHENRPEVLERCFKTDILEH